MMRRFLLATILVCSCTSATQPPTAVTETRYTNLTMGKPSGYQTTVIDQDGSYRFHYEYNDRGRGPNLDTTLRLSDSGVPLQLRTVGKDYLKADVAEEFTWEDGIARWKNSAEEGEARLEAGTAFYTSMYGPPQEAALLARAVLNAPDQRLPLLPAGEARVRKVLDFTVEFKDVRKPVALYELSGFDITPSYLWLDENRDFFASVSPWFSTILQGWESVGPALSEQQTTIERDHFSRLGQDLESTLVGPFAFHNVGVFHAHSGIVVPAQTVLVRRNRIVGILPTDKAQLPHETQVFDGTGKTLLPGLWDMHAHVTEVDGPLNLAAGVTTVRDLANDTDTVIRLAKQWEFGGLGPRVLAGGIIDGPGPYSAPTKVIVDTEEQAREAIDNYARLGFEQIKVYSSIRPELVPFIVKHAHDHGRRVSGHIPAGMRAEDAVLAGLDEIHHVNMLFLNFYPEVKETRTPARFTEVAKRGADLDLSSPEVREFIALLKERRVVVDPTLTVFEDMFVARRGEVSPAYASIEHRLPPQLRRRFRQGGLEPPEGMDQRYRDSYRKMMQMVRALYDAGVPIVAGTDAFSGFTLHRELENYVAAGIPPGKVLQMATIDAALIMKRDKDLGSIEPGKLADLILVEGNPVENFSDLRRIVVVMKNGRPFSPAGIYAALNIAPAP